MGRNPKQVEEIYTTISVRVTPEQKRLIEAKTRELQLPGIATYCRQAIMRDLGRKKAA